MDEPVEQGDIKEDKDTPETITLRIKGEESISLNALQFANSMAIVNMISKQERDLLAIQRGEELLD